MIDDLVKKLQISLDTHKGQLPPKRWLLDVKDGPTYLLEGRGGHILEVTDGSTPEADCVIRASKDDLVTIFQDPNAATRLFLTKKISVSSLPALLPLLKVLQGAFGKKEGGR